MRQNGLWDWVMSRFGSDKNEACSLDDLVLDLEEARLSFKSVRFSPRFLDETVSTTLRSGVTVEVPVRRQGADSKGYESKACFTLNPTRRSFNFASDPASLANWLYARKSLADLETRYAREHEVKVVEAKRRIPQHEAEINTFIDQIENMKAGERRERNIALLEEKISNREVWLREHREVLDGIPEKPPRGYYREVKYPTNVASIALSSIIAGLEQEKARFMSELGVLPKKPTTFTLEGFLEVCVDWK